MRPAMKQDRRLILLRHAHALPAGPGQADRDRPLSGTGEAEADAVAAFLAEHAPFARVLCSPALRTRQTAERVMARTGYADTRHDPRIYEASAGELIEVLDEHDAPSILLVGHNPGLEQLVALLCTGRSGEYRGMPPAGVAVLSLPEGAALEPGVARLDAFWSS